MLSFFSPIKLFFCFLFSFAVCAADGNGPRLTQAGWLLFLFYFAFCFYLLLFAFRCGGRFRTSCWLLFLCFLCFCFFAISCQIAKTSDYASILIACIKLRPLSPQPPRQVYCCFIFFGFTQVDCWFCFLLQRFVSLQTGWLPPPLLRLLFLLPRSTGWFFSATFFIYFLTVLIVVFSLFLGSTPLKWQQQHHGAEAELLQWHWLS